MTDRNQKKSYDKPTIMRFPLRPKEAVLGFCKSSGGNGPGPDPCTIPPACPFPGS
jgi:hypothetical protein